MLMHTAHKHVEKRRYARRKRNLRTEQIVVRLRGETVGRTVVAVNVSNGAEPARQFVLARKFKSVQVAVRPVVVVHERIPAEQFHLVIDPLGMSRKRNKEKQSHQ